MHPGSSRLDISYPRGRQGRYHSRCQPLRHHAACSSEAVGWQKHLPSAQACRLVPRKPAKQSQQLPPTEMMLRLSACRMDLCPSSSMMNQVDFLQRPGG